MLYGNVFKSVSGNVSIKFRVRISIDNYNFKNVFLTDLQCSASDFHKSLIWGYQHASNTKQNVKKRVYVGFFYFLKTKFKDAGRIRNETLLGW